MAETMVTTHASMATEPEDHRIRGLSLCTARRSFEDLATAEDLRTMAEARQEMVEVEALPTTAVPQETAPDGVGMVHSTQGISPGGTTNTVVRRRKRRR